MFFYPAQAGRRRDKMPNPFTTQDIFDEINESISHYGPTVILAIAVIIILGVIAYRIHYKK